MALKRIPIEQLTIGMYVAGCDRSWLETPFLVHSFLIKAQDQIVKLRRADIRHVDIDTEKGADVPAVVQETVSAPLDHPTPQVTAPPAPSARVPNATSRAAEFAEARRERQKMLDSVRNTLRSIHMSGYVQATEIKQVSEKMIARTLELDHALVALVRTREFDPHLYDHAVAVGILCIAMGKLLGYEDRWLQHLAEGALLHDIGLLHMPDRLLKPGRPLNGPEQREFDAHVQIAVDLLNKSVGIPKEVVGLVREHHSASVREVDADPSPPAQCCRVLKIVDAYDQLLSGQGGNEPLPHREALQQLYVQAQQGNYDLRIVSQLISLVGIYPIYSLVELNTGHRGIVVNVNASDLLRPLLYLTHGADHVPFDEPILLDLATQSDEKAPVQIVSLLDAEKEGVRIEELLQGHVSSC